MSLPKALQGDRWTEKTARLIFPVVVWCAKNGKIITYGQLDREIVNRGWGHHVLAVQYGHPAGAIGNALIEMENKWGKRIPPLNALIVNKEDGLPGKGVNYYLNKYYKPDQSTDEMSLDERRAIVEEIHADIFSFDDWDQLVEEFQLQEFSGNLSSENPEEDDISPPGRGGWSDEGESKEHKKLKMFIAKNSEILKTGNDFPQGKTEYQFASFDKADIVFDNGERLIAVEVKSIISNDADLNRGIFQCIKYQSLLRAEQKALLKPPTARGILVTERKLPTPLQNLADILSIKVIVHRVNK